MVTGPKTDDGWAYTAVYTCEKDDAYQKVEGTVTKDTTEAKPGVAGKTVYSASVPADKSPVNEGIQGTHHPPPTTLPPCLPEPCRVQGLQMATLLLPSTGK